MNSKNGQARSLSVVIVRLLLRSRNAIQRDKCAAEIREARRKRDAATEEHDRRFYRFSAACAKTYADFYCQPNTKVSRGA